MLNTKKIISDIFQNSIDFVSFDVFNWATSSDLLFTLLPILLVIIFRWISTGEFKYLFGSSDWSFVIIVLLGINIGNTIELKIHYQKDYSYRLYLLTRVQIFLIVLGGIVLFFSIIKDNPQIQIDTNILIQSQMFLLISSCFLSFLTF